MIQTGDMGSRGMAAITLKNMPFWPWTYALLVLVTTAVASLPPIPENLSDQDIAVIQELYQLWSSKSESIWPGASKVRSPILYIKRDTEYAIGFPGHVNGFMPVTRPSALQESLQARPRTLATDLSASFPVEGTAAVVIGCPDLLKKSPERQEVTTLRDQATESMSTTPAKLDGAGIASPSSRMPSRWNSIASCIRRSTSSRESPTVMTPGRSGTYAPQEVGPFS
jgi:hypothetical protein